MTLEDIGDGGDALLCRTDLTACCRGSDTPSGMGALGEWFFPNESALPNMLPFLNNLPNPWEFYRNRGQSVVRMNRRRGGVTGIYRCEIPDTTDVDQTMYIGVYTATTGEWCIEIN